MTLDLIKIRRDLHQIPEIGLEEFKTQAYLLERIAERTLWSNVLGVQESLFFFMVLRLRKLLVGVQILMVYQL